MIAYGSASPLLPHLLPLTLLPPHPQGGDVVDGTGKSIPPFHIADESFEVKHDDVGILGMANNGPDAPHTGATQV